MRPWFCTALALLEHLIIYQPWWRPSTNVDEGPLCLIIFQATSIHSWRLFSSPSSHRQINVHYWRHNIFVHWHYLRHLLHSIETSSSTVVASYHRLRNSIVLCSIFLLLVRSPKLSDILVIGWAFLLDRLRKRWKSIGHSAGENASSLVSIASDCPFMLCLRIIFASKFSHACFSLWGLESRKMSIRGNKIRFSTR
jgi:hypothetical protein